MKQGLRQVWSRKAPWYIKVARTGVLTLACLSAFPHAVENLPGEPLPEAQRAPLRAFYQQAANPDTVRIHSSPMADMYLNILGAEATTYGETIFLHQHYRPRLEKPDPYLQYILAHELGHVRQHENGKTSAFFQTGWEKMQSLFTGRNLYEYQLEKGKPFTAYGIEQQASILADYYNLTNGRRPWLLTNQVDSAGRAALYEDALAKFLEDRKKPKVPACL